MVRLLMFAAIAFSACSDDKDKDLPITPANLLGTWQITFEEILWTYSDGTQEKFLNTYPDVFDNNFYRTWTFQDNGICVDRIYFDNFEDDDPYYFYYTLSGNLLSIEIVYTIQKLTSSELVLWYRYDEGDGIKGETTETYRRIE